MGIFVLDPVSEKNELKGKRSSFSHLHVRWVSEKNELKDLQTSTLQLLDYLTVSEKNELKA